MKSKITKSDKIIVEGARLVAPKLSDEGEYVVPKHVLESQRGGQLV